MTTDLKFGDWTDYRPGWNTLVKKYGERDVRAEYTRLRNIANARLERMGRSEFRETQVYLSHVGRYPSIKEFGDTDDDKRAIAMLLSELAGFVSAEGSSVRGLQRIRAESIETLHEHGYKFVSKKNFFEFTDFMEDMRIKKINKMYGSNRVAEVYNIAKQKGIPIELLEKNLALYVKNKNQLANTVIPRGEKVDPDKLRKTVLGRGTNLYKLKGKKRK